ncbi:MAG TPA: L-serine ammonia-lyase, iron-sulfur-dependent, subunit alpha [bacterium]|nr:L-serine ammonia-lyase, iron-sulfur-dependent, subunit alpha [bacterium]HPN30975.1 L-serine ammonia-lyase, iron-sulfur-dependent, subunit alpha [bacterium]
MNRYDYNSASELIKILKKHNASFPEFILERESKLFGADKNQIQAKLKNYIKTMRDSINAGLKKRMESVCLDNEAKKLLKNKLRIINALEYEILYSAISVSEYNCSMGKIVACPTAGSCGILPAVIIPVSKKYKFDDGLLIKALLIAGEIGRIVASTVSISGARGGCMAECGTASAMTAGAVAYLFGGSTEQIFNAATLSLKNNLGLTCDPVAGLVEVPCVKRNGFKALEALAAAQMSLAGINSAIPFDEVVQTMKEVADNMPDIYKETSEGGLAIAESGLAYKKKMS